MNEAVEFSTLFSIIRNGMNVGQTKEPCGLPISRIETIWAGEVDVDRVGYANLGEDACRQWLLQPGDILFSHINSPEMVGKCALYQSHPKQLVHGMNLLCLRPDRMKLHPRFALHFLRAPEFRRKILPFIK